MKPYAALFESIRFARACAKELVGFDVLFERMGWFGYAGGLASRLLKIPLIYEVNGDLLSELEMKGIAPRGMQRKISLSLMRWAVHVPVHIVSTGEGWRQRFIEQWKVPSDRIDVIENGSELVHLLSREQLGVFQVASREDL